MRQHTRHTRLRRTAVSAACLAVAATVGLTACGADTGGTGSAKRAAEKKGPFAGMSGGEIADKALKATSGATSLRIKGEVMDEDAGLISMDLAMDTNGECAGSIGLGGQGKMEMIIPGGTVYLKYDEKFLRAQSKGEPAADVQSAVDMLAGRWAKTKATSDGAKETAAFCDLDMVLADFKGVHSAARRGGTTTVDGTPAIRLTESDGKEKYELYVATEGKPYLLRVDTVGKGGTSEPLTFGDYDKPVKTTPPTGDVLDLDKLTG